MCIPMCMYRRLYIRFSVLFFILEVISIKFILFICLFFKKKLYGLRYNSIPTINYFPTNNESSKVVIIEIVYGSI